MIIFKNSNLTHPYSDGKPPFPHSAFFPPLELQFCFLLQWQLLSFVSMCGIPCNPHPLCLYVSVILGNNFCCFSDCHMPLIRKQSLTFSLIYLVSVNIGLRSSTCQFSCPEQRLNVNVIFLLQSCRRVENIRLFGRFSTVN